MRPKQGQCFIDDTCTTDIELRIEFPFNNIKWATFMKHSRKTHTFMCNVLGIYKLMNTISVLADIPLVTVRGKGLFSTNLTRQIIQRQISDYTGVFSLHLTAFECTNDVT